MRDANRLAEDYIALWNETDQKRRLALLAEGWTADASYVDPLMQGAGHREIDGLIAAVQAKFPAFRLHWRREPTASATTMALMIAPRLLMRPKADLR